MNKKYFLISIFTLFSFLTYSQGPWDFNGSNGIWESTGTAANLTSGASFSTLDVNGAGNPMLRTFSANIDASSVTHAVITLKNNTANKQMRVFYQTSGTNRYANVAISANDSDFVTYYVDMTGNSDWTGTVDELTFQFRENSSFNSAVDGTIDIDNIEMTSSDLGVNMVNNSSFENWNDDTEATPVDPVGFYKHESVERSSDSHTGDYSIKVVATSTRDLAQTVNDIVPGATYQVSISYKLEANTGNGVRLWSTWKDASNGSLASSDLQPGSYINTVSTDWATFTVDAVAPENASKMNFEVRAYNGATVYWDSFSVSKIQEPSADPCAGVVGAPMIADDFDGGQTDIKTYTDDALTTAVVDGTSLGASGNVLQYVDNGSGYYANVQLRTCNKFDMSLSNYFTLDVYLDSSTITGTSPNQVAFKLQDGSLAQPWTTQVVATATVDQLDTWQTLVFDFNLIAGALDRTDIDNVVIQVNGEANNDPVTAYFDNLTSTAGAPATNYNVTFEVDTRNIFVGDRGMFLGGGIFGGSNGTAMSDADGDGIWTVTVELPEGTTGNYAFFNSPGDGGDWGTKENLAGQACADAGNYNDRILDAVTGDTTISYCFATCETSCTPVARYDVTFEVGTANETVTSGVFLGGGAFGNANNVQLYDADGDGIYSRTLSLPEGMNGGYKFAIDPANHYDYANSENFADVCTEGQYNDRPLAAVTEATTYSYCFGSCEAASTCALDITAPVITLIGDNPQEINNGDAYTEQGATATDDVDGDISTNIVIDSSAVDTSVDGSYTVTYDVSDAAGNAAAQVTRTVNVSTPLTCTNLESFESFPPLDWTLTSSNTSNSITQSTSYAVTGSNSLRFSSYSSAATYDQYAVTPQLVTTPEDQTISFYHKASSAFGDETFKVGWSTTGNDVSTDFTWSEELISTTTAAQYVKTDLPVGTTYVAIHYYSNYQYYMYVDDFCTPALFVPDCVAPNTLVASNISTTSADISWTSDATSFNVEYGAEGFTQGSGTTDTSAIASYSLNGLSSNTSYDVYVQTDCSADGSGTSDWVGPLTITTLCDTVTSFPYMHGFETLDCWTNSDASAAWALDAGDDYGPGSVTEGSSAVFFNDYDYSTGSTSDLMSPNLDLSALTTARLTFDYYDGGGSDTVEVLVDNGSGPVVVYTTAGTVTPWTTITVDLPDYAGQTVQIGFRGISVYGTSNPHIDNLMIAEAPSCLDPTATTASNVTTTSADISWTAGGTETAWNIEWGEVGFNLGEGTSDATTSPAYSLSGLTPNQTGYDFYVQADCGGDTSGWAGPFTFYTACDVFPGAWSNDFEDGALCWQVVNGGDPNGWQLYNNTTDGGGAVSFGIQYGATAHDDYLISPAYSVIDGVSDRFSFDARNQSASFPELFNVQVWSPDLNTLLGTLASQINAAGSEFETFSYDLSDYEGQNVRVAIHATDTNQWYLFVDNVVVDPMPYTPPSWAGDWKISPEAGSLAVGNASNTSQIWWQSAALTHAERSCLYDDIYSFGTDGSFQNILGTETWVESWQSGAGDACGSPVAPHDNSASATYTYDETAGTVTVNGVGAYLGLPKAFNGGELSNPADAPSSITYTIESVDSDYMTLYIGVGDNFWRFKLIRADLDILTDVTFTVNTANISVGANGMYLGGGVIGGANAVALSDADSDGTWEATVALAQGTSGNYIFLNSPNDGGDWGAKEQLGGQDCADPDNFNDRILDPVGTDDYTLQHCFGSCETDGSCPSPLTDPDVCAPVPTHQEADVVPVYSDAYAANIYTDLDPFWGQATDATEIQIGPDGDCNTLKYASLNYQGLLYQSTDVTTMDYVHLDYYTDNSTAIGFYVIQEGTGENGYAIHDELGITTGQWVSIDIPLSHYTVTDLSGVNQIKTDGNGTVYLDNIYFWKDSTAGIDDQDMSGFTYFPNPVNDQLTIKAQNTVEDIKVFNILGQIVLRQNPDSRDFTVDLSEMQTGAYFVQVSIGNSVETVRILKK